MEFSNRKNILDLRKYWDFQLLAGQVRGPGLSPGEVSIVFFTNKIYNIFRNSYLAINIECIFIYKYYYLFL